MIFGNLLQIVSLDMIQIFLRMVGLLFLVVTVSFTRTDDAQNLYYIEQNLRLAQEESRRSGIPISIKLGQAILESNGGRSVLATRANNHFGIKCKSYWTGARYFYTDDDRDANGGLVPSCFRMYGNVQESFVDHSDFLRNTERYQALFQIPAHDYKGWAYGLSKYGYATNKQYAINLIRVIERYNIHKYD